MNQYQVTSKGYRNKHHYHNKESRWCDLNEVPYARNGYLYGPETVEDQITGETYYQIDGYNNKNFYRNLYDGTLDPSTLFKEGDTLLIRHQQSDVRFKVTEFSPRANNMVGTRYLNLSWTFDAEGYKQYQTNNSQGSKANWQLWQDRSRYWTTASVKDNVQHNKVARPWSWQAVPKEVLLRLQLLGYQ
tara:strand:+ start:6385 stop:6948 length:564 start_codon:yes stop_codon:yes gene_type:complete